MLRDFIHRISAAVVALLLAGGQMAFALCPRGISSRMQTMPAHFNRRLATTIGALFILFELAACGGALCPQGDAFENSVRSPIYSDDATGKALYRMPFDTWVNNPNLEDFLHKAVAVGGAESLVSKYGFQCSPRQVAAPCADCYFCKRTVPQFANDLWVLRSVCVSQGDMLLHVNVGPGAAVNAMTYWQVDAVTRKNGVPW
ncbi:MAG: hypothetical protein EPO55_24010 [Reyranella sp.]|uniref:hypothetical protein n=1 Tax=Reyranella sp. TaxID=1929291 RepID=UPI0012074D67|nr:hypothetical protein [Reyranella sp.]TAJ35843.1 MAG: hypothetical protein EPO55_24010 [Reyranella sp.]